MKQTLIALFFALLASAALSADEKPNLLFIFADDQAYDTIHALGNDEIETPNLDRLVKSGTTFTHAYNMGSWSGAVCVASRTMLNTGQYIWRANKADLKTLQEKGQLWSQLLGAAGYDTYFTGKWHVRANPNEIFDHVTNVRGGMPKQTPEGYNRPIDGQPDPWSPFDPKFGGFWEGGKHWSEVLGDDSKAFLEMAGEKEAPFFMYLAFNAPHDPRQAPKEYVNKYPTDEIAMPVNFESEYPYKEEMKAGKGLRDEKLAPFPRTENAIKVNRQEYYAIITHMDTQVGRILDALAASGKADNTYVFFSADHGLACGDHGLMGKQNMYDHSVRVPFIVTGPGIEKDRRIDTRIYLQDVMATTLDLAGAKVPDHVEFDSVMPILNGKTTEGREPIYGAYLDSQRMITTGDHKLILYPRVPVARLYNLAKDPQETTDLAGDPEKLPVMKRLFARLLELQEAMDDDLDLISKYPDLR